MSRFLAAILAVALASSVFAQQDNSAQEGAKTVLARLPDQLRKDRHLLQRVHHDPAGTIQSLLQQLFILAPDGVLTDEVIRLKHEEHIARRRAQTRAQFLAFDVNKDGAIDAEEFERHEKSAPATQRAALFSMRFEADLDVDGALSSAEIDRAVQARLGRSTSGGAQGAHLLKFDMNLDGEVTAAEIVAVIEAMKRMPSPVDKQRQSHIAEQEAELEKKRIALAGAGLPELCAYPAKSEAAEVHVLAAKRGGGVSTVAINGLETETTVAQLHIEAGKTPIYLVLGAREAVIWELSGALARVERVVTHPGNAVAGLPRDKVHFARSGVCAPGPSDLLYANPGRILLDVLEVSFGTVRKKRLTHETLNSQMWPSFRAKIDVDVLSRPDKPVLHKNTFYRQENGKLVEIGRDEAMRLQLMRDVAIRYPLGVIDLAPQDLVMEGTAQAYTLLPREAGLMQMFERGELRGNETLWPVITKPITALPSGFINLNGMRPGKRFFVEPGVILDLSKGNLKWFSFSDVVTQGCVDGMPCAIKRSLE